MSWKEFWSRAAALRDADMPKITAMSLAPQAQPIAPVERRPISVRDIPEDRPQFKREYVCQLDNRARCTVVARTLFDRSFMGELQQPNGNAVWFDPDRIADRILDPTLVPLVSVYVKAVHKLDAEFIASRPTRFVDESGAVWQRLAA